MVVDMLLSALFKNRRRAVSPVIGSVLMIALAIAAGATVAAVYNIINANNLTYDSDITVGSSPIQSADISMNISRLVRNLALQERGIDDFVQIGVDVSYTGKNPNIYIMDIDILVYGVKLDEISPWSVTDSFGGVRVNDSSGAFAGYKQKSGTTVTYYATLSDYNNSEARIPDQENFMYQLKYGEKAGVITGRLQKLKISEIIFNPIFVDVGILHYGSTFAATDAAKQYEDTFTALNGSNKVFFRYNRVNDSYDYSSIVLNTTHLLENYQILIVDKWAVPTAIATDLVYLRSHGMHLIFYGSLSDFDPTITNRQDLAPYIDMTVSESLLGITPVLTDVGNNARSKNFYQFGNQPDPALTGLRSVVFDEEENFWGDGDTFAADVANLTDSPVRNEITVLGEATYALYRNILFGGPDYENVGPLLIFRDGDDTNGRIYSFTWKHREEVGQISSSAIVTSQSQLETLRENMLIGILDEGERYLVPSTTEVTIDSFSIVNISSNDRRFDLQLYATVRNGDVDAQTLQFTVDMPDQLAFTDLFIFDYAASVDFGNNGSYELNNVTADISVGNKVFLDIGSNFDRVIPENTQIRVLVPTNTFFGYFRLSSTDRSFYNWDVTTRYNQLGSNSRSFLRAVDSGVDSDPPETPTGLTNTTISSSQIDLNWDPHPNNDGDFAKFGLYRNGVNILNTTATSFSDTGLTPSTPYDYQISAFDTSGNESPLSITITGTTAPPDSNPPLQVTGLAVTPVSSVQIDLSWNTNPDTDLDHYNIYRNGTFLASVTAGTTSYSDMTVASGTTYTYEITAVDTSNNEGTASTPDSGTTNPPDTSPPATPTGLSTNSAGSDQIDLNWNANGEPDLDHYNIYRNGIFLISVNAGQTTYSDQGLTPATQYDYEISAVDINTNESPLSAIVSTTTDDEVHIESVTIVEANRGNNRHDFDVTVVVLDTSNTGVSGVSISITLTDPRGRVVATGMDISDVNGEVVFQFTDVSNRSGQYTVTVDTVTPPAGYVRGTDVTTSASINV